MMSQDPGRAMPRTLLLIWTVVFAAAVSVDAPVARWVKHSGVAAAVRDTRWAEAVKVPGAFWFTAAVVGGLWIARRIDLRRALYVFAVAAFAAVNGLVKWVVGRTRPFKLPTSPGDVADPHPFRLQPFWHGLYGLFHQVNLSFPSGHVCTATALAAGVAVVYRPAAWPLAVLVVAVGCERVAENAHYASDVVAAVGLAVSGAWLAWAVLGAWVTGPAVVPGDNPG